MLVAAAVAASPRWSCVPVGLERPGAVGYPRGGGADRSSAAAPGHPDASGRLPCRARRTSPTRRSATRGRRRPGRPAGLLDRAGAIDPVPGRPAFRPPRGGYVSMDSTDPADGTALCITDSGADLAGTPTTARRDDGIVFDSSALVPVLLGSYGSAGAGRGVRARVRPRGAGADRPAGRRTADPAPSILIEAQADCDAGAFLAWAAAGQRRALPHPAELAGPGGRTRCWTSGTPATCHPTTRPRTGWGWTGSRSC